MNTQNYIAKFFAPRGIAFFDVTNDTSSILTTIFTNLLTSGFNGKIALVNSDSESILGHKCYSSIGRIPHRIDLLITDKHQSSDYTKLLKDCQKKSIKSLLIVGHSGENSLNNGGEAFAKIKTEAEKYGVCVIAESSLGLVTPQNNLNISAIPWKVSTGKVALISDNNAMTNSIVYGANEKQLGFSHVVNVGTQLGKNKLDILDYLLLNQTSEVIGIFADQAFDIERLVKVIEKHPNKPVVLYTPSIVNQRNLLARKIYEKLNLVITDSLTEFVNTLAVFGSKHNSIKGTSIISNQESIAQYSADLFKRGELALFDAIALSENNPEIFRTQLQNLKKTKEVDTIIPILSAELMTNFKTTLQTIVEFTQSKGTNIYPILLGANEKSISLLRSKGVVVFEEIGDGLVALQNIKRYYERLAENSPKISSLESKKTVRSLRFAHKYTPDEVIEAEQTLKILEAFEINTPKTQIIRSWEEAENSLTKINYPLKLFVSSKVLAEINDNSFALEYKGISNSKELKKYLTKLQEDTYRATKIDHPPVVLQSEVTGLELFVQVKKVSFSDAGENGQTSDIFAITLADETGQETVTDILPLTEKSVERFVDCTEFSGIISGDTNESGKGLAKSSLVNLILSLQSLVATYPELAEVTLSQVKLNMTSCLVTKAKLVMGQ